MTTALISSGAVIGATAAQIASRSPASILPADYANIANVSAAIAAAVLTANTALSAPMADANNASMAALLANITFGMFYGRGDIVSQVATDYAAEAGVIVAAAKESVAKLT